jgi:hypothetical protein
MSLKATWRIRRSPGGRISSKCVDSDSNRATRYLGRKGHYLCWRKVKQMEVDGKLAKATLIVSDRSDADIQSLKLERTKSRLAALSVSVPTTKFGRGMAEISPK